MFNKIYRISFLIIMLMFSAFISQSVYASNSEPKTLEDVIQNVKIMRQQGVSNEKIASYVTKTVTNRMTFLNHAANIRRSLLGDGPELDEQTKHFNEWRNKSVMVDDEFSAAAWAWENRMGQCNEAASMAFHILVMAYESIGEITTVSKGDHRFVILGNIKDLPSPFSPDDLRSLDGTYIVDPWDNESFSTKDLSFFDLYQHGEGYRTDVANYRIYKMQYDKWNKWREENPGVYAEWLYGATDTVELAGCWLLKEPGGYEHAKLNIREIGDKSYRAILTKSGWLSYDPGHALFVVRRSNATTFDGTEMSIVDGRTYKTSLMVTVDHDRSSAEYRTKDDVITLVPCSGAN